MTIVTIHQPEHLPWLGFFDKMRQADIFVLLDTTQFAKDDFQNRNRIKTKSGSTWLTVPVFKKGRSEQLLLDTEICNDRNWRNQCWSAIYQNYREAPYFDKHKSFFEDLYAHKWSKLVDFNLSIIQYLAEQLGLKTKLVKASELGVYERGSTNVNLTICRKLDADIYLSGKYGKQYLDESQFEEYKIKVKYQDFQHPVYPQLWGEFLSNISAIDLLFNCGDFSSKMIVQNNSQIDLFENQLVVS
jgi:WbqC-like protein family